MALFVFLCPMAVQAEPVGVFEPVQTVSNTSEIVTVANPSPGGGEALIAKTNQMAGSFIQQHPGLLFRWQSSFLFGAVAQIFFGAAETHRSFCDNRRES